MNYSDINPFIRYAAIHHNHFVSSSDSICYDCRLFFVKNASGVCVANGQNYSLSHNSTLFLPPGTHYHLSFNNNSHNLSLVVIDFDLIYDFCHITKSLGTAHVENFVPERLITYALPEQFSSPFTKIVPDSFDLLSKCCEEYLIQNNLYREAASTLLKLFLIELLRTHADCDQGQKIAQILEYISSNYHNPSLTNEYIAHVFNYHPYYLSQLMKQFTGKTLHQYLIQYRIKEAKRKLITTDDPINVIAWKSGFRSNAYFIKIFKEYTGITPNVYRKERLHSLF